MIKKYQKKNGTTAYMFKAYLGIDPLTGKKRYTTKRGFKTLRAAKQAYARLQVQVQENDALTDSNRLFSELADEWLEQYRNTVKESTYVAQRLVLRKHVFPLFGKMKISKITIPFCQRQVNHWYSYYKKFSNLIGLTSSILKYALSLRLIRSNPMDGVIRLKRKKRVDEEKFVAPYYTKEEHWPSLKSQNLTLIHFIRYFVYLLSLVYEKVNCLGCVGRTLILRIRHYLLNKHWQQSKIGA